MRARRLLVLAIIAVALVAPAVPVPAAPDGTLTIGVHVTLVSRWLDPGDTEALITPFMVLYALHDALLKPIPGNISTPSLADSWTVSTAGINYEFMLAKNAEFRNGEPVTDDDGKSTSYD